MENLFRKNYLSKNALNRLEKFNYSGSDISYLYTYVISPLLENYLMKLIPLWMAPNLITLLSFIFNFICLIIIIFETKFSFEVKLSSFALLMKSFSHMAYLILDNADGKQARRTKTSSPLGLLLDHGLDAITTAIVAYNSCFITMAGNNSISSYFIFLGLYIGYFIANYEEYRTGTMILGKINGPDEGNFAVFLIAFFSFLFGTEIWQIKFYGFKLTNMLVLTFLFSCVVCSYESFSKILHGKNFVEEMKIFFEDTFWLLNSFVLPLFTYLVDKEFYFENMIFFLSLMTFIFLRISIEVLINIVCKRKIRSNPLINVTIGLWYVNLIARLIGFNSFSVGVFYNLTFMGCILGFELLKYICIVTLEIRDHLGLSLFFIPYEKNK